ncbi:chemotaxis protein CheW [Pseudomonas sp.]|uniref:chemotaxis protein CheW n=1 Tax=Pseudomonas sp. TaxID=306 RepID=UPI002610AB31|nr:chemotaxis protein CheW [Pseudomonas sp.]
MKPPVSPATRPQLALQSYLDALLFDATEQALEPLPEPAQVQAPAGELDAFAAAVLEEQVRDARVQAVALPVQELAAPVRLDVLGVDVHRPASVHARLPVLDDGRPVWAAQPFECLLFDVAGLTLAVPLVCLGSIYALEGLELTPLFGQPEWFLGMIPGQSGNLNVLDTARWVMPERYRADFRDGLQYVISVQGYDWGLAVHQVRHSLRLDPGQIKWRTRRGQRPWLAGTVIEHMCALLDVAQLAELIASGEARHLDTAHKADK